MKIALRCVIVGLDPTIHDKVKALNLLKKWRKWKLVLIDGCNPEWKDLWKEITSRLFNPPLAEWIPAFAGMTVKI